MLVCCRCMCCCLVAGCVCVLEWQCRSSCLCGCATCVVFRCVHWLRWWLSWRCPLRAGVHCCSSFAGLLWLPVSRCVVSVCVDVVLCCHGERCSLVSVFCDPFPALCSRFLLVCIVCCVFVWRVCAIVCLVFFVCGLGCSRIILISIIIIIISRARPAHGDGRGRWNLRDMTVSALYLCICSAKRQDAHQRLVALRDGTRREPTDGPTSGWRQRSGGARVAEMQ